MNLLKGQKFLKQKEFGKALEIFQKIEKKNIKDKRIFFYLGLVYFELNKYDKSIDYYNKFLKEQPNSLGALYNLALVKQVVGDLQHAQEIYLKLVSINRLNIRAYYGLYMLDSNFLSDEMFQDLLQIRNNNKFSLYDEGLINFLLSKKEKKNKKYKKEIEYLNDYHLKIFNSNYSYNTTSQFYYNKIINRYFDKIKFDKIDKKSVNQDEYEPIFIIGLPRSGSTLIESILTSGVEKIGTVGESHVVNMAILDQIGPIIFSNSFNKDEFNFEINYEKLKKNIYTKYYKLDRTNNNSIFVDKSLENFFNIEIIKQVFPNAKFLHTSRNILDSVISIYQSMLPDLSWAHSIDNILCYVDDYLRVMDTFKKKYKDCIMDIELENFTKQSEDLGKEIFDFCKLTWDQNTLNFYKRKNLYSKTLSFKQIRSKISKYDEKRYKPYFYLLDKYKDKYRWLKNLN